MTVESGKGSPKKAKAVKEKNIQQGYAARARQKAIGRELRRLFDDVVHEPVPKDMLDLVDQIDLSEKKQK